MLVMDVLFSFLSEKQRELYKNAKNVQKYKKMLKQQNQHNDPSVAERHVEVWYLICCLPRDCSFYLSMGQDQPNTSYSSLSNHEELL